MNDNIQIHKCCTPGLTMEGITITEINNAHGQHYWKATSPIGSIVCQQCAIKHQSDQPHNQQSLYYQYKFYDDNGRWPTWKDAMAHCSEEVKKYWIDQLSTYGIKV